ncbi:hypothetical protein D9V37_10795 [Nocardioides mangrovicus]|uniref:Uncharacterized protein n=1 Tax=Nocardioides mangrovicus TaxID=2478913 RepID=A0A3L8P0T8_9ACTN|nr:hypothetical protein [Nocardioides mangrovicus]RLV49056.1 hypothetical protein D9V37_10795 [Nocardioides mangrovicus]
MTDLLTRLTAAQPTVAALPDTADGSLAYLNSLVRGSSSHAEAMYSALVELAASHTLPARTLAAAYDALATLDHASTDDVDIDGRPAIKVSYDQQLTRSTDVYVFDRATGQELSTYDHSPQADFVSTTTLAEVVDAVPARVMAECVAASRQGAHCVLSWGRALLRTQSGCPDWTG